MGVTFSNVGSTGFPSYYIYKVVVSVCLSVCLFVCPIITQEPLERFASNFDCGAWESHGNVLSLVLRFLIAWVDFYKAKIVIYDQVRV